MKKKLHAIGILAACWLMTSGWVPTAEAFIVTLSAFTTYSLNGPDGNPLPEGSVVVIIGNTSGQTHDMVEFGGGLLSYSFTGDDVFIGMTTVLADGTIDAGGFTYESTLVDYLYLRFFDATTYPVEGIHAWGTTDVWGVTNQFQYVSLDFTLKGPYGVGHTNNFVIIPEADTRNYFGMVLVLGLVWLAAGGARGRKTGFRVRNG